MTRIVTTTYRYKRPPKKRKAVALEVPAIVTRAKKPGRVSVRIDTSGEQEASKPGRVSARKDTPEVIRPPTRTASRSSSTAKRKPGRFGNAADMTPRQAEVRRDCGIARSSVLDAA